MTIKKVFVQFCVHSSPPQCQGIAGVSGWLLAAMLICGCQCVLSDFSCHRMTKQHIYLLLLFLFNTILVVPNIVNKWFGLHFMCKLIISIAMW